MCTGVPGAGIIVTYESLYMDTGDQSQVPGRTTSVLNWCYPSSFIPVAFYSISTYPLLTHIITFHSGKLKNVSKFGIVVMSRHLLCPRYYERWIILLMKLGQNCLVKIPGLIDKQWGFTIQAI